MLNWNNKGSGYLRVHAVQSRQTILLLENSHFPLDTFFFNYIFLGTFLMVQCLGPCASNAKGVGSMLGWGTKIPHAA